MLDPSIVPDSEPARMAAVRRYNVLDTPADGAFDRITSLAARRFGVPISIVSIVDENRIWFKSHHGINVEQIDRDAGLCASAILSNDPHIITDASIDPRALANPLVAGDFGLRFYVGVPLTTSDGHNLGTLCVIDKEARAVDEAEMEDLTNLAGIVVDQLEMQLSAQRAARQNELMAREIDHRVMNSLQFVSQLLLLQSRQPDAGAAASNLELAANRIVAVAKIHRHFAVENADATSCTGFIRKLCADLQDILGHTIRVSGDEGDVPTTHIQPIGLLVNELVTNAAKHGEGVIEVSYEIGEETHTLIVSDEGTRLPKAFEASASGRGLGMQIIRSLTDQLQGKLTSGHRPDGGSCFKIVFPAPAS